MPVFFHTESIRFTFNKRRKYKKWISAVLETHLKIAGNINIIFTSNEYLLGVNRKYLNHNYNTDVITFDYNEENIISGDIFVSVDQVKINSKTFESTLEEELSRVVIHGVLHLLGFNDSSPREKLEMKEMEDKALMLLNTGK